MSNLNSAIAARCSLIQASLMLQYNSTASTPSPVKGFEREIFIGELLSNMVPPHYRIGTGIIVDSYGHTSTQTDIVVEYPYGIRFPIGTGATSLYLAESVAASIEVKSNFSKQWPEISEKIYNNRKLLRRERKTDSTLSNEDKIQRGRDILLPIFIVAYKGPTNPSAIFKKLGRLDRNFPAGVLIIESSIFIGISPSGVWTEATGAANSIFAFMSQITDWMRHDVAYTWDLDNYLLDHIKRDPDPALRPKRSR